MSRDDVSQDDVVYQGQNVLESVKGPRFVGDRAAVEPEFAEKSTLSIKDRRHNLSFFRGRHCLSVKHSYRC